MSIQTEMGNGFTINMTAKVAMPDVDYINELAQEKNFSLGSSFINPPKILEDLYSLFKKENDDPMYFDLKNHLLTREYLSNEVLKRPLTPGEDSYYTNTLLFLNKIEFSNVIGITALDKALNVLMMLIHLSSKTNPEGNPKGDYGNDTEINDPTPKNIEVPDEKALSDAMSELGNEQGITNDVVAAPGGDMEGGSGQNPDDSDELSDSITKCVRDHLYDLTPSIANVYGAKKPSDVPINRKILGDIKIKAYLENTKGMETSLDSKKVKNNDSNEKKKFQMDNHSQITKVNKSSMMMVNFDDKFIKKELAVKEKVKPEEKKQILYMLLDDSGSMSCKLKQTYVRAVLLNRLESVVEGKSELKFSLYESERYGYQEVKDKKGAQKLFKEISLRRPRGGGTYIGNILQQTINDISSIPGYHDPEIMIVCDGDDHVDPDSIDAKGVRINVILLGRSNSGLKKIAENTEGFYTMEKMYN